MRWVLVSLGAVLCACGGAPFTVEFAASDSDSGQALVRDDAGAPMLDAAPDAIDPMQPDAHVDHLTLHAPDGGDAAPMQPEASTPDAPAGDAAPAIYCNPAGLQGMPDPSCPPCVLPTPVDLSSRAGCCQPQGECGCPAPSYNQCMPLNRAYYVQGSDSCPNGENCPTAYPFWVCCVAGACTAQCTCRAAPGAC